MSDSFVQRRLAPAATILAAAFAIAIFANWVAKQPLPADYAHSNCRSCPASST